jgi:hypothetical protein
MSAIETAVRIVVDLLVRGRYDVIDHVCPRSAVTGQELKRAVADYGRTLVAPGHEWWATVDVMPFDEGGGFHIAAALWTEEEGRSDLTLELRLIEIAAAAYEVQVLDLRVLQRGPTVLPPVPRDRKYPCHPARNVANPTDAAGPRSP